MSQWSKWSKLKDKQSSCGYRVRRYRTNLNGKIEWETYPTKQYADFSLDELDKLINRLNASHISAENLAKERYKFDHAYVNPVVMEKYTAELESCMDRPGVIAALNWLNVYVFNFFILQQKVSDPSKWHKIDTEWGKWLQQTHKNKRGKKVKLSIKTILMIVQAANRFLTFLNDKGIYKELDAIRPLKPIGRGKIKTLMAESARPKDQGYIPRETFQNICQENKDNDILPNFKLMYWYGLRISESLGVERESFRVGHLSVSKQGISFKDGRLILGPIKTRDSRKVPHWFVDAKAARDIWLTVKPMHPDTLQKSMNDMLRKYGLESHDCRRTFITNAIKKTDIYQTQLAAGHQDIRTTMKYQRDDRNLEDDVLD